MSTYGRLSDIMRESLIEAPGGYTDDIPGPLYSIDRDVADEAVDRAIEIAWMFIASERAKAPASPG